MQMKKAGESGMNEKPCKPDTQKTNSSSISVDQRITDEAFSAASRFLFAYKYLLCRRKK